MYLFILKALDTNTKNPGIILLLTSCYPRLRSRNIERIINELTKQNISPTIIKNVNN